MWRFRPKPGAESDSITGKTNRLAKLKQCKLDDRSEQWLSQASNKECKVDLNESAESPPFSTKRGNDRKKSLHNLETMREEEIEEMSMHENDLESLMNCHIQSNPDYSDSRVAFSGSSCNGSSTGSDCCFGSVCREEEDGCLDDWEDIADASSTDNNQYNSATNAPAKSESRVESAGADQQFKNLGINQSRSDSRQTVCGSDMNSRAWRPDDTFRLEVCLA
ncbi:hypothetical protein PTKIN_Ptkin08bG0044000 [Pterospermum kingtungense]